MGNKMVASISIETIKLMLLAVFFLQPCEADELPCGFVYVDRVIPDIKIEIKYYTDHNFVGEPIDGYQKPAAILTKGAAQALAGVQNELRPFGLGLKIFDAYRPQQAVDHFVRWAGDLTDLRMKREFYPEASKKNLFKEGYIAAKSSHSRGSTVDITIVSLQSETSSELDMGSAFDFFGRQSWPNSDEVSSTQRAHRMLLQVLMEKHGFVPYEQEWWHFTLKNESYPKTWFNFPVK